MNRDSQENLQGKENEDLEQVFRIHDILVWIRMRIWILFSSLTFKANK